MENSKLIEIVVQAAPGENPLGVARDWARRLDLQNGTRVAVLSNGATSRPRRFVVYDGEIVSPQRYTAITIAGALEELLRAEGRPMDEWEILMVARRQLSPIAGVSITTIRGAARMLVREKRLRPGPERGTWAATQAKEAAA